MSKHTSEEELFLYLDGAIDEDRSGEIEHHQDGCEACSKLLLSVVRVHVALTRLPVEARAAPELWEGIAARVATPIPPWSRSRLRTGLQAIAASLLVALGFALGHADIGERLGGARIGPSEPEEGLAKEVQRAGTEYAAALVSLSEVSGDDAWHRQASEVAHATGVAASIEIEALKRRGGDFGDDRYPVGGRGASPSTSHLVRF